MKTSPRKDRVSVRPLRRSVTVTYSTDSRWHEPSWVTRILEPQATVREIDWTVPGARSWFSRPFAPLWSRPVEGSTENSKRWARSGPARPEARPSLKYGLRRVPRPPEGGRSSIIPEMVTLQSYFAFEVNGTAHLRARIPHGNFICSSATRGASKDVCRRNILEFVGGRQRGLEVLTSLQNSTEIAPSIKSLFFAHILENSE